MACAELNKTFHGWGGGSLSLSGLAAITARFLGLDHVHLRYRSMHAFKMLLSDRPLECFPKSLSM